MYFLPEKKKNNQVVYDFELPNIRRSDRDQNIKNLHIVTDSETAVLHGQRIKQTSVVSGAGTTTIAKVNDFLITIDDLAVTRNVELPSAAKVGKGKLFKVKDLVGGAATTTITIASKEGETIDGAATTTLTTDYEFKAFVSNGTNWFTI